MLDTIDFGHAFARRQLVFVNGRYAPDSRRAAAAHGRRCVIRSLREVLDREPQLVQPYLDRQAGGPGRPFAALNTAFLDDGAFVSMPEGTVLPEPIHVVFLSAPRVASPRPAIRASSSWAGRESQAAIVESYGGTADAVYLTNAVTEIALEDGAVVDHYRLQRESARAFHVGTLCATQGRASRFASHAVVARAPRSAASTSARSSRVKAASAC